MPAGAYGSLGGVDQDISIFLSSILSLTTLELFPVATSIRWGISRHALENLCNSLQLAYILSLFRRGLFEDLSQLACD